MKILACDTALGACSVAVLDGQSVLAHRFAAMDRGHAEALAPMTDEAMRAAGLAFKDIERLAVTVGPGTFTGQRVGLAFMRGLRLALGKPLNGVTTLAAMAQQAMAETGLTRGAAIHDAKRNEFYVECVPGSGAAIVSCGDAIALLKNFCTQPAALAGTGAQALASELGGGAILSQVRAPDALYVARLALDASPPQQAPRPLYLRAPDAKLPGGR